MAEVSAPFIASKDSRVFDAANVIFFSMSSTFFKAARAAALFSLTVLSNSEMKLNDLERKFG